MKYRNIGRRYGAKVAVGGALVASGMGSAMAASASYIDAGVQGAFSQYGSDVTTMSGYAWPVLISVVGIGFAISLFKTFARKAH